MSTVDIFLWIVVPYVAIAVFVVGHVWRYRRDQFGWTSRSTELLERRMLRWGSLLFHYGLLAVIGGHVLGLLVPQSATEALGVSEHAYHLISATAGTLAGSATVVGLLILAYRRARVRRVARTTTYPDLLIYSLLFVMVGLGMAETVFHNTLASGNGYNYRESVSVWFRGIFLLQNHAALMASAPLVYKLHALCAWALFVVWPFSRLVHVWSVPLTYLRRAPILYRSRAPRAAPPAPSLPPLGMPAVSAGARSERAVAPAKLGP